ncbi:conjugative transposon protein TraM [Runella limosa]|uniref:conjugative transposon protein TraM n=1 Tax=Runella limosa TaxID=370978 RepID=UPI00041865BD|nr:conjugative transposon protein TraM [Runella limosa]
MESASKVKKLTQKQYQFLLLGGGALFAVGLMLWGFGVFKSDTKDTVEEVDGNDTKALEVVAPKNKALTNEDKFKTAPKNDSRFRSDQNASLGYVVGEQPHDQQVSNEGLTDADFRQIETAGGEVKFQNSQRRKQQLYAQSQARQRRIVNEANQPLFHKTQEDVERENRERDDREINQRQVKLVLDQMEKNNTNSSPQAEKRPSTIGDKLRQDDEHEKAFLASYTPKDKGKGQLTELYPETSKNTIGNPYTTGIGFYNVSTKNKQSYNANDAILAVIHSSEAVKVQEGSVIKVRLLQNTIFKIGDDPVVLEKGTLLNGRCTVGDDRVFISFTSLVKGTAIYPLTVQAFDLDGQQGIYVPNLREKNILARRLTQAAMTPTSGASGYFIGQGNIAQQVGTQMAVQTTQQAMQSARQVIVSKAQIPKITIRPNYQMLLKSASFTPTTSNAPSASYENN